MSTPRTYSDEIHLLGAPEPTTSSVRLDAVDALAKATELRIGSLATWRPGELRLLLSPGSMPAASRVAQLLGGGR